MEVNFFNEDAIKSMLDEFSRRNQNEEAEHEISLKLQKQLHNFVKEYYKGKSTLKTSILDRYKSLNPNAQQIRTALIALLETDNDKGEKIFYQKNHWLSVFKVLCFLGIKKEEYACMADMENYIKKLNLDLEKPFCNSFAEALNRKNIKPFNGDLYKWEMFCTQRNMEHFWLISITFLQILERICGSEYQSTNGDTEVHTEPNKA